MHINTTVASLGLGAGYWNASNLNTGTFVKRKTT